MTPRRLGVGGGWQGPRVDGQATKPAWSGTEEEAMLPHCTDMERAARFRAKARGRLAAGLGGGGKVHTEEGDGDDEGGGFCECRHRGFRH